jgi:hypothetical protein
MSSLFPRISPGIAAAACTPLQPVETDSGGADEMARLMAQMQEPSPSWLEGSAGLDGTDDASASNGDDGDDGDDDEDDDTG